VLRGECLSSLIFAFLCVLRVLAGNAFLAFRNHSLRSLHNSSQYLSTGGLMCNEKVDDLVQEQKGQEGEDEDDPAGHEVVELIGNVRPVLGQDTGPGDPDPVEKNRDRDRGEGKKDTGTKSLLNKVREQNPQRQKRKEGTDTTAGLSHFELHRREKDDIALIIDGDIEKMEKGHGDLGRQELQLDGEIVVKNVRRGNHEKKEKEREDDPPGNSIPEVEPDHSNQKEDHGDLLGKTLRSDEAEEID